MTSLTYAQRLQRLFDSDLSVNSGVYAGVDPGIQMALNDRGEYQYTGLDGTLSEDRARELLSLSGVDDTDRIL